MTKTGEHSIYADALLTRQGWVNKARLYIKDGIITKLAINVSPQPEDECHSTIIPGLDNVHSHAFQRAMSGLVEKRGTGKDSFWSWRHLMYDYALRLSPDDVEIIATQLYMEMLETGFTRVGEFHYLHHDQQGNFYNNIAEMASHIANAAQTTGIALTLLPVFYAHSGFGGEPPNEEQRRFINSLDSFAKLWHHCADLISVLPSGELGLALHSLRAVTPAEMRELLPLATNKPLHIHIAEQTGELHDCISWSGTTPVNWLMNNAPVDKNWTLIHATHIDEAEIAAIKRTDAIVGLCPITEANLGDGTFPASYLLDKREQLAIGSDSNILISVPQELRQLEYSQRLVLRSRNVMANPGESTGWCLYDATLRGGAQSIRGTDYLEIGKRADFITLQIEKWANFDLSTLLDQWIFGQDIRVDCVFVGGKKWVMQGRHLEREKISADFTRLMQKLRT